MHVCLTLSYSLSYRLAWRSVVCKRREKFIDFNVVIEVQC